jgi:hypothetical protein
MSKLSEPLPNPHDTLTSYLRTMLNEPFSGEKSLKLDVEPDVSVVWRWESPTLGSLSADVALSRVLNMVTLTHLAYIALPSAMRYPAIVVADQRKHRLRLFHANLEAEVGCVMFALESLLNQRDVLSSLLIEGSLRTSLVKQATTSHLVW